MPENIEAWWARRQRSKGVAVPYAIGTYRADWERYPVLVRQFHPDLNRNITLTQIPPAAEVYLTWQCDTGHVFVATPEEQRSRPGRVRRRSSWCPDCLALAAPQRIVARSALSTGAARGAGAGAATGSGPACTEETPGIPAVPAGPISSGRASRSAPARTPTRAALDAAPTGGLSIPVPGEAFHSGRAPKPASAAEGELRSRLAARLELDLSPNAVKVRRPFFTHREVWPDVVLPDLRVAIEYDTIGKFGLEHVGTREATDRRKDRLLREVGWEVIRVRCGKLQPLGEHDIVAGGVTATLIERIVDALRDVRGDLLVNAYLR